MKSKLIKGAYKARRGHATEVRKIAAELRDIEAYRNSMVIRYHNLYQPPEVYEKLAANATREQFLLSRLWDEGLVTALTE